MLNIYSKNWATFFWKRFIFIWKICFKIKCNVSIWKVIVCIWRQLIRTNISVVIAIPFSFVCPRLSYHQNIELVHAYMCICMRGAHLYNELQMEGSSRKTQHWRFSLCINRLHYIIIVLLYCRVLTWAHLFLLHTVGLVFLYWLTTRTGNWW